MNKIKQISAFVYESENPFRAFLTVLHSVFMMPALFYHELMHILALILGTVFGPVHSCKISKFEFFKVIPCKDHKLLSTSMSISYNCNVFWGKMVTLAPLVGWLALFSFSLFIFNSFLIFYCIIALPTFYLSDIDIDALGTLNFDEKKLARIKQFKNFLNK